MFFEDMIEMFKEDSEVLKKISEKLQYANTHHLDGDERVTFCVEVGDLIFQLSPTTRDMLKNKLKSLNK